MLGRDGKITLDILVTHISDRKRIVTNGQSRDGKITINIGNIAFYQFRTVASSDTHVNKTQGFIGCLVEYLTLHDTIGSHSTHRGQREENS